MSVVGGGPGRETFTAEEANEIRALLDPSGWGRRAARRIAMARLRRMGLGIAADPEALPTQAQFEELLDAGLIRIDEAAAAIVKPLESDNVFRVSVGVTGDPIEEAWSAFDQRFQWFSRQPRNLAGGAHLFVLAVDRWRSGVVGLHEAVSAGAAELPGSSNPERWPWAVGVRPLAAIPPPLAERVEGQIGPQGGTARITDPEARARLYAAVASSKPPPGPKNLEQRVQEVERRDVVADVVEAVRDLGKAQLPGIVDRAIEIGEWSPEELAVRAWYTGGDADLHVEHVIRRAIWLEQGGLLKQVHGIFSVSEQAGGGGFGAKYRRAADGQPPETEELPSHLVDLAELERATKRHMDLQDRLADALAARGVEPRSPTGAQPQFDLAFEHAGKRFVVEVKSGHPVPAQQARLGAGQVLEYRRLLGGEVTAVLMIEAAPPHPWAGLAQELGLELLCADQLEQTLDVLLKG